MYKYDSPILVVSSEFPPGPGGIGHHAFSLSKALVSSGYRIIVLSPADYASPDEVETFDESQNFEIIRYSKSGNVMAYLKRLATTLRVIKSKNVSRIILTGKSPLWQGLIIKLVFSKAKTLAILHGSEINLSKPLFRWLTHKSIASTDILVPVSAFTKSLLPDYILKQHPKITIIPNGIDDEWSSNTSNISMQLKGYPVLLTVGHVSPRKGQHRVIRALPTILQKYPDAHYHIVGLPLTKHKLEPLIEQLNLVEHVTFHNRVPNHIDLSSYYNASDIFMLLSENQPNGDVEGFGIVALEANLHGLPVVGAKFCGVEEAVFHRNSGFLVNGDKPEEIAQGIEYCLMNKQYLSSNTILWAKQHKWSEIVSKYNELLS